MHHPIEECPKQDISEETSNQAPGEEQPPGFKEFVPPPSSLENEQHGEKEGGHEIKNEAIESGQPQDPGSCPGQCWHRGAAVVQDCSVASHSYFTDELWPLTLGHDSCHLGSDQQSQQGAADWEESDMLKDMQAHFLAKQSNGIVNNSRNIVCKVAKGIIFWICKPQGQTMQAAALSGSKV